MALRRVDALDPPAAVGHGGAADCRAAAARHARRNRRRPAREGDRQGDRHSSGRRDEAARSHHRRQRAFRAGRRAGGAGHCLLRGDGLSLSWNHARLPVARCEDRAGAHRRSPPRVLTPAADAGHPWSAAKRAAEVQRISEPLIARVLEKSCVSENDFGIVLAAAQRDPQRILAHLDRLKFARPNSEFSVRYTLGAAPCTKAKRSRRSR